MKKLITMAILLIGLGLSLSFHNEIVGFLVEHFIEGNQEADKLVNNSYAKDKSYQFVQLTNSFEPNTKQDLLNIFYTVINSGMSNFTFYCPKAYKDCLNDVDYISNNQLLLSNINNYVPIYNSFQNIETEFDSLGKVNIKIHHTYSKEQIEELESITTKILQEQVSTDLPLENQIKIVHDYIINHTKYDKDRSDNQVKKYHSDTAYGALLEHYAICGGYADSMKLFLDKLGIDNYKISSENHIWNLVYVDGKWVHLDLTWDDPVTDTGEDILEYDYFLISTEELFQLETDQHHYDQKVYSEVLELK